MPKRKFRLKVDVQRKSIFSLFSAVYEPYKEIPYEEQMKYAKEAVKGYIEKHKDQLELSSNEFVVTSVSNDGSKLNVEFEV